MRSARLLHATFVLRLLATALACLAFAALVVGSASDRSTQEVLRRETVSLLPAGARVLDSEYRERCHAVLALRSPPCISARFRLAGPPAERVDALVEQAGERWRVARRRHGDVWDVSFRRGELRAVAYVQTRRRGWLCRSRYLNPLTCEDYLRVELGPPAVFPELEIRFPHELIPEETRWRKARPVTRD